MSYLIHPRLAPSDEGILARLDRYMRPDVSTVRQHLSQTECDQLLAKRTMMAYTEYSERWNKRSGAQP